MDVELIEEAGYRAAMAGLSLSHKQPISNMSRVSFNLSTKDLGHNKFMESMMVWFMVRAPRYWWQQSDTYRIATKQSESTMHTIMNRPLVMTDFEPDGVTRGQLRELNKLIRAKDFFTLKKRIPESVLQSKEWGLSYKTLRNIIIQRHRHKLPHWQSFIQQVVQLVRFPELIPSPTGGVNNVEKTKSENLYIQQQILINGIPWMIHRFVNDNVVLVNLSGEPPFSMTMKEIDVLNTDLFRG